MDFTQIKDMTDTTTTQQRHVLDPEAMSLKAKTVTVPAVLVTLESDRVYTVPGWNVEKAEKFPDGFLAALKNTVNQEIVRK